jgi:dTDP-4-amino-4,6-dideoxygalactose transaminase
MKIDWPYEFPGAYWLDEQEEEAVLDVIRSKTLFRYYGLNKPTYVDKLEETAKSYYGAKYALAVNSGTGALTICMQALGIGLGCEVIVPSFMWVATIGAVIANNAIPVLCEVDESFTMSPADLERKITPRTKLIVPIHMAGAPCDMDAIIAIAKKHKIAVLEDCAQCNGGSYKGKKVGTFGDMGIFSLQFNKNMTCGEGGLILTNNEKLYHKAFAAHDMGLIRVGGRLSTPDLDVMTWGQGRRMTELCGAIASVQLTKLDNIVGNMRASKRRIKSMLSSIEGLGFRRLHDGDGDTGPFLIMVFEDEVNAASVAKKMKKGGLHNVFRLADYGLHIYYNIPMLVTKVPLSAAGNPWSLAENAQCCYDYQKGTCPQKNSTFARSILLPIPSEDVQSCYDYQKGTCPQSDDLFARSVLLPIPSKLTSEQEQGAVDIITNAVMQTSNV